MKTTVGIQTQALDPRALAGVDFQELQDIYESRTGLQLMVADMNGAMRMGMANCDRFPCMHSCRDCRENIIREALRTGQVCVDTCHEGYCIWGLPMEKENLVSGGIVVIGGELTGEKQRARFEEACAELYHLMLERDLLPKAVSERPLPERIHRFVERKAFRDLQAAFEAYGRGMILAMNTAEFAEARMIFAHFKKALRQANCLPIEVLRGMVGDLIFRARSQFVEGGMDAYACSAESGLILSAISGARGAAEIATVLETFLDRFAWLLSQRLKDPDDRLIEKATTFLEEHLREDLNRDSVAKAVGISPSHFSRLLREKKGRTFTDLLSQYRIERASHLLVRTSLTLAEVAGEAGFCDQSYFSKVFRKYKGQTPAHYREAHRI